MAFLSWSNEFSTGVASYDAEHKKLAAMVNELHDAMTEGKASSKLGDILDRLVAYTVEHFNHEEKVLARHDYPDLARHKQQHEQLKTQVLDFRAKLATGSSQISIALLKFLKDWLLEHIQKEDKKYGPFLNAKGVL